MSEKASAKPPPAKHNITPPCVGDSVLVTTRQMIAGQTEHAAIVTKVHSDDVVNVMIMPGDGMPYPVASVSRMRLPPTAAMSWRPRLRERT